VPPKVYEQPPGGFWKTSKNSEKHKKMMEMLAIHIKHYTVHAHT